MFQGIESAVRRVLLDVVKNAVIVVRVDLDKPCAGRIAPHLIGQVVVQRILQHRAIVVVGGVQNPIGLRWHPQERRRFVGSDFVSKFDAQIRLRIAGSARPAHMLANERREVCRTRQAASATAAGDVVQRKPCVLEVTAGRSLTEILQHNDRQI